MKLCKAFITLITGGILIIFMFIIITSKESSLQNMLPDLMEPDNRFHQMAILEHVHHLQMGCAKLKVNGISWQDFDISKLDHIIVEDKYKVLYCYVPKVACTNLKRIFLLLTGKMNVSDPLLLKAADVHSSYGEYLTHLNELTMEEIEYRLTNYMKVIFVRDPLERILSAFRNKFLQEGNEYFSNRFGKKIVRQYRANASQLALQKGHDVTFSEFVNYLLDPNTIQQGYNEHWKSFYDLCHPCHMQYNFIGKYETLDNDVNQLLKELGVHKFIQFPGRDESYKTNKTEDLFQAFYESLDQDTLKNLTEIYSRDYELFGYTLPPSLHDKLSIDHNILYRNSD